MREIEFRGKRYDTITPMWIEGFLVPRSAIVDPDYAAPHWIAIDSVDEFFPVITNTIGQYTGLEDINGIKIFEGDILRAHNPEGQLTNYIMGYDSGLARFLLKNQNEIYDIPGSLLSKGEIIGNIHDNPEMLEAAE
jgi:uncharacterized phage protein (TIGR01671 family)